MPYPLATQLGSPNYSAGSSYPCTVYYEQLPTHSNACVLQGADSPEPLGSPKAHVSLLQDPASKLALDSCHILSVLYLLWAAQIWAAILPNHLISYPTLYVNNSAKNVFLA